MMPLTLMLILTLIPVLILILKPARGDVEEGGDLVLLLTLASTYTYTCTHMCTYELNLRAGT